VYLGTTREEFLAACDAALGASAAERARRASRMREILAGTSWNVTVAAMEKLIAEAMARKSTVAA
jgi:UDP-galactopyranose mutase